MWSPPSSGKLQSPEEAKKLQISTGLVSALDTWIVKIFKILRGYYSLRNCHWLSALLFLLAERHDGRSNEILSLAVQHYCLQTEWVKGTIISVIYGVDVSCFVNFGQLLHSWKNKLLNTHSSAASSRKKHWKTNRECLPMGVVCLKKNPKSLNPVGGKLTLKEITV